MIPSISNDISNMPVECNKFQKTRTHAPASFIHDHQPSIDKRIKLYESFSPTKLSADSWIIKNKSVETMSSK